VEIMDKESVMPADIKILNKTEAAEALPDLFTAPIEEPMPVDETIPDEEVE
jgi:hypothetical protein